MEHAFTIGVEEESQIVEPNASELRRNVSELLASSAPAFGDRVRREMHQIDRRRGDKICASIEELAEEIIRMRRDLTDAAERVGLRIAAAGAHPFAKGWISNRSMHPVEAGRTGRAHGNRVSPGAAKHRLRPNDDHGPCFLCLGSWSSSSDS